MWVKLTHQPHGLVLVQNCQSSGIKVGVHSGTNFCISTPTVLSNSQ